MTFAYAPAVLYSKIDVLCCMGITPKDFHHYIKIGVIPPPDGREGNAHRWNSNVIKAIASSRNLLGKEHTYEKTLDILLKQLESFECSHICES